MTNLLLPQSQPSNPSQPPPSPSLFATNTLIRMCCYWKSPLQPFGPRSARFPRGNDLCAACYYYHTQLCGVSFISTRSYNY